MKADSDIDTVLDAAVQAGAVPGVLAAVVDDRRTLYEGGFGRRGLANDHPMSLDTVVWFASMTKALVAAGAMQLIEQGRAELDEPAARYMPELGSPQVLEGFDDAGKPRLRAAKRPITVRHLFTHTSGFGYDIWNADVLRYMTEYDLPPLTDCRKKSLHQPLACDPGTRWEYGISIDWVGQLVETLSGRSLRDYLRAELFDPLGMVDTDFIIGPSQRRRLAGMHQRHPDGTLEPIVLEVHQQPEFFMGGGGCYGTVRDYAAFVQMIAGRGRARTGARVLKPETVALMGRNAIGELAAGELNAVLPTRANSSNFFPGMRQGWGLSFLINPEPSPAGRSAGSLCWGGLANTYYWIDPTRRVGGVIATQILPFADPTVLALYDAFERAAYRTLVPA
ncbi:MAG TPA: serine hydrolase domain-containing protein [Acetobacteraceae bacterium]|nr:serine hydrolase domain-containing protein [Acetobacteraceae bacterium]